MAKPKLALIPAAQGTKFYSVLPSNATGDFTFTRGSVATRINAQGLIENVASGQSRLNYPLIDGVQKGCPHHILEPARTNIFTYSEQLNNSDWIKDDITVTSNLIISPTGSLNADKIVENTSSSVHSIAQSKGGAGVFTYTSSVFAKTSNNDRYLQIWIGNTINAAVWVRFDLDNGIITQDNGISGTGYSINSSKIEYYGNGWYRCSFSVNKINTTGTNTVQFRLSQISTGAESNVYTGNGTSGVYLWGAQLEVGSYTTSYIPTNGESGGVTRSAETATGAGNSTTFNDSEGVLMAEISALANDLTNRYISISDGTANNRILIRYIAGFSNTVGLFAVVGGTEQATLLYEVNDILDNIKVLVKYKQNDYSLWVNGFEVDTDTIGIVPSENTLDRLNFANIDGSTFPFYGKAKQVQYFDSILADTQLEQLTSWQSFRDMAEGQLYTIE